MQITEGQILKPARVLIIGKTLCALNTKTASDLPVLREDFRLFVAPAENQNGNIENFNPIFDSGDISGLAMFSQLMKQAFVSSYRKR